MMTKHLRTCHPCGVLLVLARTNPSCLRANPDDATRLYLSLPLSLSEKYKCVTVKKERQMPHSPSYLEAMQVELLDEECSEVFQRLRRAVEIRIREVRG